MKPVDSAAASVFVVLSACAVSGASAQDYPHKSIRLVTAETAGSGDFAARLVAQGLTNRLGQQVIVDNRAGVATIPAMIVIKAAPDGYTLLVYTNSFWVGPLMEKRPYDPIRDFAPITVMTTSSNTLVVHPSVPVNSVKELIALAKAKPGQLNYSSAVTGSSAHLAGELFKSMAGVDVVRVPYKGNAPALVALMAGETQIMFPSASAVGPHLKSGKLKALAVTSAEPSELAPGLPTVAASGLPGYESVSMGGMFAPARTPATIISRLNREVVEFLNQPDVKDKFFRTGVEVVGSTPQELTARVKSEMTRMGKVIKDAGIKAD